MDFAINNMFPCLATKKKMQIYLLDLKIREFVPAGDQKLDDLAPRITTKEFSILPLAGTKNNILEVVWLLFFLKKLNIE